MAGTRGGRDAAVGRQPQSIIVVDSAEAAVAVASFLRRRAQQPALLAAQPPHPSSVLPSTLLEAAALDTRAHAAGCLPTAAPPPPRVFLSAAFLAAPAPAPEAPQALGRATSDVKAAVLATGLATDAARMIGAANVLPESPPEPVLSSRSDGGGVASSPLADESLRSPSPSSSKPSPSSGSGTVSYTDMSVRPDPPILPVGHRKSRGGVTEPFPEKLHRLLSDAEKDSKEHIAGFFPHGRAFCIFDPGRFEKKIMPRYFNQTKISSFQRQLNNYGFTRINDGPDAGGYYHELFLKGRPALCTGMRRILFKGDTSSSFSKAAGDNKGSNSKGSPGTEEANDGMEEADRKPAPSSSSAAATSPILQEAYQPNFYTMPPITTNRKASNLAAAAKAAADLRKRAKTATDLRKGAKTAADLHEHAKTAADLRECAKTAADLRERAKTAPDLRERAKAAVDGLQVPDLRTATAARGAALPSTAPVPTNALPAIAAPGNAAAASGMPPEPTAPNAVDILAVAALDEARAATAGARAAFEIAAATYAKKLTIEKAMATAVLGCGGGTVAAAPMLAPHPRPFPAVGGVGAGIGAGVGAAHLLSRPIILGAHADGPLQQEGPAALDRGGRNLCFL